MTAGTPSGGLFLFRGRGRAVFLLVWMLGAAYVFAYRNRGWIPHDEGILGQAAESVANGALPHRDFPEIYTGGLSYWNALAFRLFGVKLTSIRLMLFLSFVAFLPAVFAIATRFGPPLAAGAVTLLAAAWSLPNYFTAIPSWYNLFLAAWAVLFLLRHVETGRARWLFFAGLCVGVSCLFKIIGAHVLAAALLYLIYWERDATASTARPDEHRKVSAYLIFLTAGLGVFLLVLFRVVQGHLDETEFVYFLLPSISVCGFLIWREYTEGGGPFASRLAVLVRSVLPLVAGVLVPIALFVLHFAVRGAIRSLANGLVASTGAHVQLVRMWLPTLGAFLPALPYAVVLGAGSLRRFRFAPLLILLLAVLLVFAFALSRSSPDVYLTVWHSARFLAPIAVVAACLRLFDSHRLAGWSAETRQKIFLLTAIVALTGLVQFPFAAPIYFFYFAPLLALQVFALAGSERRPPQLVHAAMLIFYLSFALFRTNPGFVYQLGHQFERYRPQGFLDLPRAGGLKVVTGDARLYGVLVPLVQQKSGGRPIYAGPDCPEITFLSGLAEVTEFSPDSPRDPMERPEDLLRILEAKGTRAVVLNRQPAWARKIRPQELAGFEAIFPHSRTEGQFVARWRE